jgi:hypothetical protein
MAAGLRSSGRSIRNLTGEALFKFIHRDVLIVESDVDALLSALVDYEVAKKPRLCLLSQRAVRSPNSREIAGNAVPQ